MDRNGKYAYTANGYTPNIPSSETLSRFNGEYYSPLAACYPLGNGNRHYSPSLMRFISPDTLSPFDEGGINLYTYCSGDPINYVDPSGKFPVVQLLNLRSKRPLLKSAAARERHPLGLLKPQTAPRPTENVPAGYKLVGYHGSLEKHKKSLEAGIRLQPGDDNTMGDGFYFSSDYNIARKYDGDGTGRPQVFGVYAKNFNKLKKGVDFDYYGGSKELFVIRQHAFDNFIVRAQIEGTLTRRKSYSDKSANRRR